VPSYPPCSESNLDYIRETRRQRAHLTERQIDSALADTFPASDPPAWY
jgi:hypothetical protein